MHKSDELPDLVFKGLLKTSKNVTNSFINLELKRQLAIIKNNYLKLYNRINLILTAI